jgi:enoyl-CoA hydratase/carnithine racemase
MTATNEVTNTDAVLYEKKDHVAWVTMNRPEALNSMNDALMGGVGRAMREANDDPDVFVVVLIGEGGRAFCAGNDLKAQAHRDTAGADREIGDSFKVYDCEKPVIAAIDGYAVGGGMQWASQCDIRVATEQSQFGQPEPRVMGSGIAGGIDSPDRYMPFGEASYISLTGARISAKRAYDIGYIQSLVPDRAALIVDVERICDEIKLCAPMASHLSKRKMRLTPGMDLPLPPDGKIYRDIIRDIVAEEQAQIAMSEDRLEAPKAFAEKRAPVWKGR